jgi:drug/metabolite transporter (DMT)-like permease
MKERKQKAPVPAKLALIAACFFWAASFIAIKTALDHIPPLTMVTMRYAVSSLCFLLWLVFRGKKIAFQGPAWLGRLFLLSIFGTGLQKGIETVGMQYTTASNASLYTITAPISIAIIAALFLGEKITWKKALGIGCALLGVLIVMGIETLMTFELKGHVLGDLLVIASIFMWGIFTVMGKDMTRQMNAVDLTAVVTFIGTLYMIPIGGIETLSRSFSLAAVPFKAWTAVAFLGITCSFLATLLYFFALERTESQKVGVYMYTIPPMSYIMAALVLKETIGINLLIGSLIVLTGVYLTEKG